VVLHRAGVRPPAGELFAAARAAEQPEAVRRFAVRGLGAVLGVDALPPLCELLRAESPFAWEARLSLGAIGAAAVPALLAMLGEHDANTNYRAAAAGALGVIRSADARDGLLLAARDDDYWVATEAVAARIATGGPRLPEDLIDLLTLDPRHAPSIAEHFTKHPVRAAAPALEAALQHMTDVHFRRQVQDAITACRR
jgi:HEAT repeat protein